MTNMPQKADGSVGLAEGQLTHPCLEPSALGVGVFSHMTLILPDALMLYTGNQKKKKKNFFTHNWCSVIHIVSFTEYVWEHIT